MTDYAVVFKIRELVVGNGWLASVYAQGRALATNEDGIWWLSGVQPGGMDENGQTPPEAWQNFALAFRRILNVMAREAESYEAFAKELKGFYGQIDEEDSVKWESCRSAVRSGAVAPEKPFSGLPRDTSAALASLEVENIAPKDAKPALNEEVTYAAAA